MKNCRTIVVTFMPPTNQKGARIKLSDPASTAHDKRGFHLYGGDRPKPAQKVFSYCYRTGNVLNQAVSILNRNGWNIVGTSDVGDHYAIMCDNWNDVFYSIRDAK
jgi:hypothetical protein